ncbi:hypothetical protein BV25DRAFT_1915871 [Artomyces pyxidatus]|uniref:Uncharacterized protein n=1 Tax=Artomyces pyxidatus TaxID=48021 RepID=A0ACB8T1M6_9AGAM|nr:hypothetical protein BV25DRAFT_1915871 [Artomyces pyxidatus]
MLLPYLFLHAFLVQIGGGWPLVDPTLSIASNGTALLSIADTSATCTDIAICRTRYTIIWSSLVTILACVWSAVHRNIPGPARSGVSRARRVVGRVLEVVKIVVVTLLVPEWVLAWAVRQFLNARDLAEELEGARFKAQQAWKAEGWVEEEDGVSRVKVDSEDDETGERVPLADIHHIQRRGVNGNRLTVDECVGRLRCKWTTQHGFFVVMGGYLHYEKGKPKHPLSRTDVVALVESGDLVPPLQEEIQGWSQGDALSKALAVIQTLWFVVQCIARRAEGLPIMQLEVVTLAYTTITVAMYMAWWYKPQNIGGPIRVAVPELPERGRLAQEDWYTRVFYVIIGGQDDILDLRREPCVPTFYSGGIAGGTNDIFADTVALVVAMVFGAIHCAAWNYNFPSYTEQLIWRISSVSLVGVPGILLLGLLLLWGCGYPYPLWYLVVPVFALSALVYVAARLVLLILSFTTLRAPPYGAYEAVRWTLLIPHFS